MDKKIPRKHRRHKSKALVLLLLPTLVLIGLIGWLISSVEKKADAASTDEFQIDSSFSLSGCH